MAILVSSKEEMTGTVYTLPSSETLIVTATGQVISHQETAIKAQGGGNDVTIAGHVAAGFNGVQLGARDGDPLTGEATLMVHRGASITAWNYAVSLSGNSNSVLNAGTISGAYGIQAGFFDSNAPTNTKISNSGSILGGDAGMLLEQFSGVITNSGVIQSGNDTGPNGSSGLLGDLLGGICAVGDNIRINNSGEIYGGDPRAYGIAVGGTGTVIVNTGTIQTISNDPGRAAVDLVTLTGQTAKLTNGIRGEIVSHATAVQGDAGNETVINSGSIIGDVLLGGGNDLYDGRKGTVDGKVVGGDGNDTLYGGVDDDRLEGGTGNDLLMGGAGADRLIGGTGTDTVSYVSAKSGVTVNLAKPNLNAGDAKGDTFSAIENITGSRFNDKLIGNSVANVIDGGDGADRMEGGAGNDRYIVDNIGDVAIEASGGGTDRVVSSVSFTLGQFIEELTLSGSDNIKGTGNNLANLITGSAGKNTLDGKSGNDTLNGGGGNDVLIGGLGKDTLTGGNGKDFFVFNTAPNASTNVDTITDFNVAADTIRIDNAVFSGLANGTLAAAAFKANTSGNAGDASDRIIYETDTGRLYFDADGTGAGAKIQFATLNPGLALTNADFVVI